MSTTRKMKCSFLAVAALTLVVSLVACGGGGGGGSAAPATGTFTKTVDLGGAAATGAPFYNAASRTQHLYLASDIKASGMLQSIIFVSAGTATPAQTTCSSVIVKAGHSLVSSLTTTFGSNLNSGSTQTVYNGPVTIPAMAAGGTYTFTFSQPFNYNGVDNLILDYDLSTGCNRTFGVEYTAIAARMLFALSSGATTGAVGSISPNVTFTFAGGDNLADYGGGASSLPPFSTNAGFHHLQMWHSKTTISGSGPITGIGILTSALTTAGTYTVTIKLGHSVLSALTATFASNFSDSPVTVASNLAFNVPANMPAGSTLWLPVTGSFTYNGTDNLIVDVDVTGANANMGIIAAPWQPTNYVLLAASGSSTGSPIAVSVHTKFRFNGGTMDVMTPGGMSGGLGISFPFNNTDGKFQFLHQAYELGAKGAISKFMCRNAVDADAETGFTYTVVMSHTTATMLDATFATNLISPVTVYSGTFDVPAKKKGDWIEIPLTTPFAYNGKDNLVTQIAGSGGPGGGFACITDNAMPTLYVGRAYWAASSTALTGLVQNIGVDARFAIQP